MREDVSHADIYRRLEAGDAKFDVLMDAVADLRAELGAHREEVRPLLDNINTINGVVEVTKAASIWRKFLVGTLGLLVLVAAAGGVVAGAVLGIKHWIIEGAGQ